MDNPLILLFKGDPKKAVARTIMYVTDSPYTHTAVCIDGFTFESTVWKLPGAKKWQLWKYRSGVYVSRDCRQADTTLGLRSPLTPTGTGSLFGKALALVNARARYAFLLLLLDAVLYPTRRFWRWIYRKTGWAPFTSPNTNCSGFVDRIFKEIGLDLWPGAPESLTVPGDYPSCELLMAEQSAV